jgi:hypothetical protein
MKRFIGRDAHVQTCTVAVMGPSGRRIGEHVVETHARALRQLVRSIPGERHLCLEEGSLSAWLYETLEPEVDELVVCVPPATRGNKSDARDAWTRADELRRDAIERRVYKAPRKFRQLREAARAYETTRKDMVRAKQRLRSVFRERGFGLDAAIYDAELGVRGRGGRQYRVTASLTAMHTRDRTEKRALPLRPRLQGYARPELVLGPWGPLDEVALFAGDGLIEPFRAAALNVGLDRGAFERLLDAYYAARGWDRDGLPTPETLARLDLDATVDAETPVGAPPANPPSTDDDD